MSVIPKISVGLPKKREKFPLNFDNSTTANIGCIQPTMAREMVPNSKFSVKVSSLVRLASMPLPTFGRISLRHNHVFVPYNELWQPFDAMLSGQHFRGYNASFIPTQVPFFKFESVLPFVVAYSDVSIYKKDNLAEPLKIDRAYTPLYDGDRDLIGKGLAIIGNTDTAGAMNQQKQALEDAINAIRKLNWFKGAYTLKKFFPYGAGSLKSDSYGVIRAGDFYIPITTANSTDPTYDTQLTFEYYANHASTPQMIDGNVKYDASGTVISYEGADLITTVGDYMLCFKFKAPIKRLRTIFLGLGYHFSPYDNLTEFSVLKLLAYYKGWFALFRPDRQKSFVDTNCYELLKYISEYNGADVNSLIPAKWEAFLGDLIRDCYYYLPMDYFGMSVIRPSQSNQDNEFAIDVNADGRAAVGTSGVQDSGTSVGNVQTNGSNGYIVQGAKNSDTKDNPLLLKLAMRLMTYANKNTVIGRNIRDYLKVHYGVADVDPIDSGDVIRIGSSRVNVNISDVMSTAENAQGFLGEYGGKGIGYNESDKFTYETDKFGVWITYTVVVPESGYYQGYLLENRHRDRYHFFMPEFDALGYQVLERGEIMDAYHADSDTWDPKASFQKTRAFGFVPRYSEYKVGRNIVNGDLSLEGLKNSMSPYTLDRRIPSAIFSELVLNQGCLITKRDVISEAPIAYEDEFSGITVKQPTFVPSVVYDEFRRIDPTDHLGQYNRIFNYGGNDLDHFIIHNIFNVTCTAPMKSLTTSFDTYGEEDDASISIEKA